MATVTVIPIGIGTGNREAQKAAARVEFVAQAAIKAAQKARDRSEPQNGGGGW